MRIPGIRPGVISAATLVLLAGSAAPVAAQAFVPERGEASVTMLFQSTLVKDHLVLSGPVDSGHIQSQGIVADFSVGLGRKFALSVGVPYIGSKYTGTKPHLLLPSEKPLYPTFTSLDDGRYHSTWQDFRAELRYGLRKAGFAISPFVGTIVPSHDYEYLSHAAVGRDVRELQVGVYAARILDPWLPRVFIQAGYTHGFEQRIVDISRQRSIVPFEGGYFATPSLRVFGLGSLEVTHGGIDVYTSARADYQGLLYINHDRIQRENMLNVGAGAAYTLSDRTEIVASFTRTVWGINGHAQWGALTVGVSYGINPHRRLGAASGSAEAAAECHGTPEDRLEKCVCLRK
ncbi:MAG: hypothetical protein ACHQO8_06650 [Vicinamibacterales bacterium]